ncbi:MAG: hypothetical protein U9R02_13230 [Thermodesulfobacteriota bacterium]|nr:hypothetical protein [Thermodesulfobacteriota bacterium]
MHRTEEAEKAEGVSSTFFTSVKNEDLTLVVLGRRHRDGCISCEKFKRILEMAPLPLPKIVHNI